MIASANAVIPIMLMLIVGYIMKRSRILTEHGGKAISRIVFGVFLPVLLFDTVYTSPLSGVIEPKLIGFAVIVILLIYGILWVLIPHLEHDNAKRGVLTQGILRSNFGIFGLPVAFSLCGDEVGPIPLMVALIVPLYSALSIVILEYYREKKSPDLGWWRVAVTVLSNPLIVGAGVGIIFAWLGLSLPTAVSSAVSSIADLASPLALIVLGSSFSFGGIASNKKQLAIGLIGKLLVIPMITLPICVAVGFRGVELVCLMIMMSAPTAVSTHTMAQQMGADYTLAGQLVVLGSALSVGTMFIWITVLKSLGLF